LPDTSNIAGTLANANFIASLITTFIILAFACKYKTYDMRYTLFKKSSHLFIRHSSAPKEVVEEEIDHTKPRRKSSLYEAFTKGAKTSLGSLSVRIYVGFFFEGLPLLIFAIIYPTEMQAIALSFIVGIGDSLAQSGIFPLAGSIHPRCTAAASLGSAVAGLIAGLLRLLTKAIFPETDEGFRHSSSMYFSLATVVIVVCCLALYSINKVKNELTMAFFQQEYAESVQSVLLQKEGIQKMIRQEMELELAEEAKGEEEEFHENEQPTSESDDPDPKKKCGLCSVFVDVTTVYREAFRCAWVPILVQFVNFFITLSLFPGITLSMTSESLGSWMPVILVTVFNLGKVRVCIFYNVNCDFMRSGFFI